MIPIVVGNLMMGRCFTLAKIPFIGVTSSNDQRIFFSRYCQKGYSVENPAENLDQFFQSLKRIGESYGGDCPLFYTNDGHLKAIARYYDEIQQYFRLLLPDKRIIAASLDKNKFIDLADEYSMPTPFTRRSEDLRSADEIDFPVIIKPITRLNWFNSRLIREIEGKEYKVIFIRDSAEFEQIAKELAEEKIEYIVQKFIAGPEANIISFHSFFTAQHEPLGYYVGRKIRTLPARYGLSSALRLIHHEEVVEKSLKILRELKFVGPIKIDYKLDDNDGKLYLLELNVRYNMWHYLGARAGINLPALAYRYFQGDAPGIPLTDYRDDIRWVSFFQDVSSFKEMRRNHEISFGEWLRSLRGRRIYQTLAFDDLRPVLYAMLQTIKGFFRRIHRVFA